MNEFLLFTLICFVSYLLGSIPVGFIISKSKGVNIQKEGSGNIGGTNVGRILGPKYGLLVVGLDFCKGALPVLFFIHFFWHSWLLAGLVWLCVILGNIFPVWLKFKGGRGVSVFFGGLFAMISWELFLVILICWIAVFLFFTRRRVSAANLIIVALILVLIRSFPVFMLIPPIILTIVFMIWWRHWDNLKRLSKGEEPAAELPSALSFLNKLPDDLIGLLIEKLQLIIQKLQDYQKEKEPRD